MNLFWRYGQKIRKWDDRLIVRSVIFCFMMTTMTGLLIMIYTSAWWSTFIHISEGKLLNGLVLLLLWDTVLLVLAIGLIRKNGSLWENLENRQLLARMLLDNAWYETDLKSSGKGDQNLMFMARTYFWRRHSIMYFPRMYYKKRRGEIYVTVKIDMGKYQEGLLHLEKKIETGLDCEIVGADYRHKWMHYVFTCEVLKNRIGVEQMEKQEAVGKLRLMKHILWDYEQYPHALIVGGTGSGKTSLLLAMIEGLAATGAKLTVIDAKNADIAGLKTVLPEVYYEEADIRACMSEFYESMRDRMNEMQLQEDYAPGKNYRDYGMRAHFLIFDEYVAFMEMLSKKEWEEPISMLKRIVLLGRQAGFFVVLACQRPDAKYLPDGMRDQFGLRIGLGKMEDGGYTMLFGSTEKNFVEKEIKGRGYIKLWNGIITEFYSPKVPKGYDFIRSIRKCLCDISGEMAVVQTTHLGMEASGEVWPASLPRPAGGAEAGKRQGEA